VLSQIVPFAVGATEEMNVNGILHRYSTVSTLSLFNSSVYYAMYISSNNTGPQQTLWGEAAIGDRPIISNPNLTSQSKDAKGSAASLCAADNVGRRGNCIVTCRKFEVVAAAY